MSVLHRRMKTEPHNSNNLHKAHTSRTPPACHRVYHYLLFLPSILSLILTYRTPNPLITIFKPIQVLNFTISPDEETTLSTHRLPLEDHLPTNFQESAIVCMPTVQRPNVQYITNAIKSFRIATRNSTQLRRLLVYTMDYPSVLPTWLDRIFDVREIPLRYLPSWLVVYSRQGPVSQPRKATLGDSWERVLWRSKEALDYAQVLQRCAKHTKADFVIIVQDDVLFRHSIKDVIQWSINNIRDEARVINGRRVARVCSASLFDIADGEVHDGDELKSSNMVARIWRRDDVDGWVKFFKQAFDEAPIDWLADRRCRSRRGWVTVMWPNPVRHRGKVSSFSSNKRDGLLT